MKYLLEVHKKKHFNKRIYIICIKDTNLLETLIENWRAMKQTNFN